MNDGPRMARPGFVSLLPGGKQVFPIDPVLDAARNRQVKEQARREGRTLITRRIPKEGG
jgi:hypothetical protein